MHLYLIWFDLSPYFGAQKREGRLATRTTAWRVVAEPSSPRLHEWGWSWGLRCGPGVEATWKVRRLAQYFLLTLEPYHFI